MGPAGRHSQCLCWICRVRVFGPRYTSVFALQAQLLPTCAAREPAPKPGPKMWPQGTTVLAPKRALGPREVHMAACSPGVQPPEWKYMAHAVPRAWARCYGAVWQHCGASVRSRCAKTICPPPDISTRRPKTKQAAPVWRGFSRRYPGWPQTAPGTGRQWGWGLQAGLTPTQQLPDGEFWGRNGQRWNFPRCLCMGCTASHGRAPGPAPAPRGEPIFTAPRSESFSLSSLPLPKTSSALPQLPGPPVYSLPAPKPLISLFGPW